MRKSVTVDGRFSMAGTNQSHAMQASRSIRNLGNVHSSHSDGRALQVSCGIAIERIQDRQGRSFRLSTPRLPPHTASKKPGILNTTGTMHSGSPTVRSITVIGRRCRSMKCISDRGGRVPEDGKPVAQLSGDCEAPLRITCMRWASRTLSFFCPSPKHPFLRIMGISDHRIFRTHEPLTERRRT